MELLLEQPIFLVILFSCIALLAGYIDAIAGGGGTIQVTTLLLSGIPPISVLATNKIVSMVGTLMAITKYAFNKKIQWKLVFVCLIPCIAAAYLGSQLAIYLSSRWLQVIIFVSVVAALFITLWSHNGSKSSNSAYSSKKAIWVLTPIAFYDGIAGPGTGTYLTIFKYRFLNFSYIDASATAKPLNLATNFAATVAFLTAGKVFWPLAAPMIFANAIGGWLGSHYAIKHGSEFVRKVLLWMVVAMLFLNLLKLLLS